MSADVDDVFRTVYFSICFSPRPWRKVWNQSRVEAPGRKIEFCDAALDE
jgi:hypothetical protein